MEEPSIGPSRLYGRSWTTSPPGSFTAIARYDEAALLNDGLGTLVKMVGQHARSDQAGMPVTDFSLQYSRRRSTGTEPGAMAAGSIPTSVTAA